MSSFQFLRPGSCRNDKVYINAEKSAEVPYELTIPRQRRVVNVSVLSLLIEISTGLSKSRNNH